MDEEFEYRTVGPKGALQPFVDSFWMLHSTSGADKRVVGLPDGRIDLMFSQSKAEPFHVVLIGLGNKPHPAVIAPGVLLFAISFKLPAAECILQQSVADLVDGAKVLPSDFWDFGPGILADFDAFCERAAQKIRSLLPPEPDARKVRLFDRIYASKGELPVRSLAEQAFWSARQINRYFNAWFGMSLKMYCRILRFRASLDALAHGQLFPELDFADQNHFIKEVKAFSGAVPTDLFRNQNDRFILVSAIRRF